MRKFLIALMLVPLFGSVYKASAQTEPVTYETVWIGKHSNCYCPLNLCLEVCWCDETSPGSGVCVPGTEECNIDCNNTLFPTDVVVYQPLTVNVPTGKHIMMKKLIFRFQCEGEPETYFEFDLMQPDGDYFFPTVNVRPGCPGLWIHLSNGHVEFSTN